MSIYAAAISQKTKNEISYKVKKLLTPFPVSEAFLFNTTAPSPFLLLPLTYALLKQSF